MPSHDLILPELGIDAGPIVLSLWLVVRGSRVEAGDPVAEILAGAATIDLPAPVEGRLAETLAAEGDVLQIGQRLAVIDDETA